MNAPKESVRLGWEEFYRDVMSARHNNPSAIDSVIQRHMPNFNRNEYGKLKEMIESDYAIAPGNTDMSAAIAAAEAENTLYEECRKVGANPALTDEQKSWITEHLTESQLDSDWPLPDVARMITAMEEILGWVEGAGELVVERATGTTMHKVCGAISDGEIVQVWEDKAPHNRMKVLEQLAELEYQAFVIEHNWAAAFAKAQDFASGEYQLPFDTCFFDFRISGKRIALMVWTVSGVDRIWLPIFQTTLGWTVITPYRTTKDGSLEPRIKNASANEPLEPLLKLIESQVRAVCIALEAEVATTEVVRASHKLNRSRERNGRLPICDYHVVSLARRTRAEPLERAEGEEEHEKRRSPRLHFRRGHWRHFGNHRTWIKWMLVGDPDLGFIDKHYRL